MPDRTSSPNLHRASGGVATLRTPDNGVDVLETAEGYSEAAEAARLVRFTPPCIVLSIQQRNSIARQKLANELEDTIKSTPPYYSINTSLWLFPCERVWGFLMGWPENRPNKYIILGGVRVQARTRRTRLEKGAHPYRVVLQDVVMRLRGTKLRLEALMGGDKPDEAIPWCALRILSCKRPLVAHMRVPHIGFVCEVH